MYGMTINVSFEQTKKPERKLDLTKWFFFFFVMLDDHATKGDLKTQWYSKELGIET